MLVICVPYVKRIHPEQQMLESEHDKMCDISAFLAATKQL